MGKLFSECSDLTRTLLMSALLIGGVLLLIALLLELSGGRRRPGTVGKALAFAGSFVLLVSLVIPGRLRLSGAAAWADKYPPIPAWGVLAAAGGASLWSVWTIFAMLRGTKEVPDSGSVRQGVNNLPDAVCFFTPEGRIKLCNYQMYRLYRLLAGRDLQYYDELREALYTCPGYPDGQENTGSVRLFPDGTAWSVRESETRMDGRTYRELVLSDVTGLYRYQEELKRQSEELRRVSEELRALSEQVQVMTREKEILRTKTRLHDQMGEGLTAVRQSVLKNLSDEDTAVSLSLLRRAVNALDADNGGAGIFSAGGGEAREEMEEFFRDAAAIGVEVRIEGEVPEEEDIFRIFMIAIREALTNSARHADATGLFIRIRPFGEHFTEVVITDNGRAAEGPVQIRGGLANVRRHVENAGGRMDVLVEPVFTLRIYLPVKMGGL